MADKKKKRQEERKKVDIFSLFQKEKTITFENNGNTVQILLVKLTQNQREKAVEKYMDAVEENRAIYKEKDAIDHRYTKALEAADKTELIEGLISYEKPEREQLVDLYPMADEHGEETEITTEKEIDLIGQWEKSRRIVLENKTAEELKALLRGVTIDGLARLSSSKIFDWECIHYMCLNPDTRERIFATVDDVGRITDASVIDRLTKEMGDFRQVVDAKSIRKISQDNQFLESGESPEKQDDSQPSTMKK